MQLKQHTLLIICLVLLMLSATGIYIAKVREDSTFIEAAFIENRKVNIDKRIQKLHGSWTTNFELCGGEDVAMVYQELKKIIDKEGRDVILLDIGASTGSYSLLPVLSKNIKVVAFEPNPLVLEVLRVNVNLNHISDNVLIVPIGISDKKDILALNMPAHHTSTGLATFAKIPLRFNADTGASVNVPVDTLDNILEITLPEGKKVDFIKIDTEGWEYFVLLGAKQVIQRDKPLMFLEFFPRNMQQAGVNPERVLDLLSQYGYTCVKKSPDLYCSPL